MIGNLLERLRVPCATKDSKDAAAEIERLTAENAKLRGCLEFIAKPVQERNGIVGPSEAHIRAAAARDVLNQQSECKTCGGSKVEKATAGNGYHRCPNCA